MFKLMLLSELIENCWFVQLDIYSLSRKWKELVDKARAKQLQPQEYNSGTLFTSHKLECLVHWICMFSVR